MPAHYAEFHDKFYKKCFGGSIRAKSGDTILVEPIMITSNECDEFGNSKF